MKLGYGTRTLVEHAVSAVRPASGRNLFYSSVSQVAFSKVDAGPGGAFSLVCSASSGCGFTNERQMPSQFLLSKKVWLLSSIGQGHCPCFSVVRRTMGDSAVVYSSRRGNPVRGPVWRNSVLSREATVVVQELKLAKGDQQRILQILETKAARLLKVDLLLVLNEIMRQDNWPLTLQIFDMVRKEVWYKPDGRLYAKVIACMGRCRKVSEALALLDDMKKEKSEELEAGYTATIHVLVKSDMLQPALDLLREMRANNLEPEAATYQPLIQAFEAKGETGMATSLAQEWETFRAEMEAKVDPSDKLKFHKLIAAATRGKLKVR